MTEIRDCWYRVSTKALVLDETRTKFLIVKEENGLWELPGGGLEWNTTPHEDLPREIDEEMGLVVTWIAPHPCYFLTGEHVMTSNPEKTMWVANILYETELENLDFTPSKECVDVRFINKDDLADLNTFPNVIKLAEMFNPSNHTQ